MLQPGTEAGGAGVLAPTEPRMPDVYEFELYPGSSRTGNVVSGNKSYSRLSGKFLSASKISSIKSSSVDPQVGLGITKVCPFAPASEFTSPGRFISLTKSLSVSVGPAPTVANLSPWSSMLEKRGSLA